jgi:hypothetical protein
VQVNTPTLWTLEVRPSPAHQAKVLVIEHMLSMSARGSQIVQDIVDELVRRKSIPVSHRSQILTDEAWRIGLAGIAATCKPPARTQDAYDSVGCLLDERAWRRERQPISCRVREPERFQAPSARSKDNGHDFDE